MQETQPFDRGYVWLRSHPNWSNTEMRFILCTWFGEFCSCCSLTVLPGPAWVLLNWICKELISSLYLYTVGCFSIPQQPGRQFNWLFVSPKVGWPRPKLGPRRRCKGDRQTKEGERGARSPNFGQSKKPIELTPWTPCALVNACPCVPAPSSRSLSLSPPPLLYLLLITLSRHSVHFTKHRHI